MRIQLIFLYLLISLFFSNNIYYSQDFGKVGTKWSYTWQSSGSIIHLKYESVKDSLLNGKTAQKIEINQTGFNPVFIYQNLDTVFQYSMLHNEYYTYLIFNKNKGDTLYLEKESSLGIFQYRMVVDTVFNIFIDGISLKKYLVRGLDAYSYTPGLHDEYIVDRIGSLDYFFTQNSFSTGSAYGPLRCYEDSIIDTNFTTLPCGYRNVISINEFSKPLEGQIKIFPNPTQSNFSISFEKTTKNTFISLFDITGKEIVSKISISKLQTLICLENEKSGIYFIRIETNGKIVTKKVIKY